MTRTEPNVTGEFEAKTGLSGKTWLYRTDVPNSGDFIYVSDPSPSGGMRGFGGSELRFDVGDGVLALSGPWHSNSDALFEDTGIDLTMLHSTIVVITSGEDGVIYAEDNPVLGLFNRGHALAEALAAIHGGPLKLYSESNGGSSTSYVGG